MRLVPRRWRALSQRSARLRLTLLYSGMFLLLGTVLIVVILVVFARHGTVVGSSAVSVTAVPSGRGVRVHDAVTQQRSADVASLLAVSWLTLVLTAVASAPLGWFAAGRMLRPLREMTASARTISAGNLHDRLALAGPPDEFKQLGDTVDDLLARLEAAFAAQRRFVANAAHELRTPLTLERTLLQVALADPDANEASLRATCEELLEAGRNHERLLEGLLTLATGERGLERREWFDLAPLAQRSLDAVRPELESRSLDLRVMLPPASVLGDPALVQRLVANLVGNAVRYNRPHGWIELECATSPRGTTLRVANSGPVVPAEAVEGLFEPFHRLGSERVADNGHYGLGLSIARAIATAHGATITAEARPEGGLSVTVAFPAGDQVTGAGTPPPPAGTPATED
jgi:signal transduction histidine kinase